MNEKTYPVLSTSRSEIVSAIEEQHRITRERFQLEPVDDLLIFVRDIADDSVIEYIARKAGDWIMEGGDYYGALIEAAIAAEEKFTNG